jgi:hypothetical protein
MALINLPPELLLRVATFLTTPELGHLRLSCKRVESTLFDSFAREFFTKKQFMLEEISLQALVDISNHPTLAPRLSEVVISTHTFPYDPKLETFSAKALYEAGYVHHNVLLASGQAQTMLSDAFSKLPNLKTVGLRDYMARGRYRDGKSATWKSWGWSFGWEHTPADLHSNQVSSRPLRTISPEPILPLLLLAMGHAKVKALAVNVFLRLPARLTPLSFNCLSGYTGHTIRPMLGEMKELMLSIGFEQYDAWSDPRSSKSKSTAYAPLARLLQHTPKLSILRLNFDQLQPFGTYFLKWLGTPCFGPPNLQPSTIVDPVSMSHLTALELGMLNVSASVLLEVLKKFNLESFSLWKCVLQAPRDSIDDCWRPLLHDLATALPPTTRLKSVLIGFASQMFYGTGRVWARDDPVYFKPVGAGEERSYPMDDFTRVVKHHAGPGTSIKDWLEEVSQRTYPMHRGGGSQTPDSMETGSDMDGEDDEDEDGNENDEDEDGNEDDDETDD